MECQKPITSESCGVCAYRTNEKQAFREICEQHKRYIEEKEEWARARGARINCQSYELACQIIGTTENKPQVFFLFVVYFHWVLYKLRQSKSLLFFHAAKLVCANKMKKPKNPKFTGVYVKIKNNRERSYQPVTCGATENDENIG